ADKIGSLRLKPDIRLLSSVLCVHRRRHPPLETRLSENQGAGNQNTRGPGKYIIWYPVILITAPR
ncbi:MAG: hypothetical protein MUO33_09875, partial [Sedimentisphaerales bacterium]|nr:hypothetical protein [Sedimentisphaerales bacterium]